MAAATGRISHHTKGQAGPRITNRISHHTKGSAPVSDRGRARASWLTTARQKLNGERLRALLTFAKKVGIGGAVLTAAHQMLLTTLPAYYDPAYNTVMETVGSHRLYAAITREPAQKPNGEGSLSVRDKFMYDFRVTDLAKAGWVYGRFRMDDKSVSGDTDPEWWLVKGVTDGKKAELTYSDEAGNILGHITLTANEQNNTEWSGSLSGFDPSIPLDVKGQWVRSPIVVGGSRYDVEQRLKTHPWLEQPSTLVEGPASKKTSSGSESIAPQQPVQTPL